MNKVQRKFYAFLAFLFIFSYTSAQEKKVVDSLKKSITKNIKAQEKSFSDSAVNLKLQQAKNQYLQKLGADKLLKKDAKKSAQLIDINSFSIENSSLYISSRSKGPSPNFLNNTTGSIALKVYNFPLQFTLSNYQNELSGLNPMQGNLFKFNKPDLKQMYMGQASQLKDYKKKALGGMDVEVFLRKEIEQKLKTTVSKNQLSSQALDRLLNNPNELQSLLNLDETALKAKITNELNKERQLIIQKGDSLIKNKQAYADSIILASSNEITSLVSKLKTDLSENGIDASKIAFFQKMIDNKVDAQDLENFFMQELSTAPSMHGIQKFYSKVKTFQAGNYGTAIPGSFLNQNLFLNGFNTVVKTNRGPVKIGVSSNSDLGLPKDGEFNSSTFATPKLYTYLSVPATNFRFGSGKLSWVGQYDKAYSNANALQIASVQKNSSAFTLSQDFASKKIGKLTFELSKSASQYTNMNVVNAYGQVIPQNGMLANYFKDDFLQTLSLGVNHDIDSKKMGLTSNVFFSYSGSGFQNPGVQAFSNMGMRFGGNIRKQFLKNNVTLAARGDFKHTPTGSSTDAYWENFNGQLDSRIRLSRKTNINLKYIKNGVNKVGEISSPVYQSEKFQFDLNSSFKVIGLNSFSHLSIGNQNMANPMVMQNSHFLTLNYAQSVVFKKFTLTGNLFYNKELNAIQIIGNMTNADLACQYSLTDKLSLSSGLTFLDNQGIAKQFGLKQNIQLQLGKHFDVSAYLDVRKNLISPLYPDLYSSSRGDFSVRYYFDKLL